MTIVVKNAVRKFYDRTRGEFAAVDDISFSCHGQEIFGLLGPNGAGKSTMLRMIATLLVPHAGSIEICGVDVQAQPQEVRRQLGFLSAETRLYNKLTPREILTCFGQMAGMPDAQIKRRVEELIETFDLKSYADVRCEKLSTGMKQKVSIARAIVHDPPVICLDEPTTGLDVLAAAGTHQFVRQARASGKCVLFSTHNMHEAEKLCDRMAVIHRGKLLATGTLAELQEHCAQHYLEDIFIALVQEKTGEVVRD